MRSPRRPLPGCGLVHRLSFPTCPGTIRPGPPGRNSACPQRGPRDHRGARPATPSWPALPGACTPPRSAPALSFGPRPADPLILGGQVTRYHIGHGAEKLLGIHLVRLRLPLKDEAVVHGEHEASGATHVHVRANEARALGAGEEPSEGGGAVVEERGNRLAPPLVSACQRPA